MALMDFFKRKNTPNMAGVYALIVKQARRPFLFGADGAPDSFDGRFDMMVLHVHLVLRRLRAEGVAREALGQDLFDRFFRDMDQAMREMGVGDLGVGKKIRKMAQAYYGRAAAYDDAMGKAIPAPRERKAQIGEVLARNLSPQDNTKPYDRLADYTLALEAHLAGLPLETILHGDAFAGFEWR